MQIDKIRKKLTRKKRVRSKVSGTSFKPRMSVFRSNKHLFVQLIDDQSGKTLVSASDFEVKVKENSAFSVGENLAKKALGKKLKEVVFDKNGYMYHGKIKDVADGARKGGLKL